jgi:hypothetical protein
VAISFNIISWQGYQENGFAGFCHMLTLNLWLGSMSAACSWFGVVVFGFGMAPFVGRQEKGKITVHGQIFIPCPID